MQPILDWGIKVVLWLQQASPYLDWPMRVFSALGSSAFIFCLVLFIYWNLDHRVGARLALLFIASTYVNITAKVILNQPRPLFYDPGVLPLDPISGGGLPSGHTQAVTVAWVYLATQYRKRWLWIVTGVILILVPLSRVYLGAHFPTDLAGGYLVGLVLVALWRFAPQVESWLVRHRILWTLLLIAAFPALAALSMPYGDEAFLILGADTGYCLGLSIELRWLHYHCSGSPYQYLARFMVGVAPALLLWLGDVVAIFSILAIPPVRFIYYTLMGVWVALGAPWAFQRLQLASCLEEPA